MKIVNEYPPIYDAIEAYGMRPNKNTIYTYGDTLYNPNNCPIADHLIAHEETHSIQQAENPEAWWGRYLIDPYFRIEQEAQAYARQYSFLAQTIKDRNQRFSVLHQLSITLSSPLYGSVITYSEAQKLIKKHIKL